MNIHPPINALVSPLNEALFTELWHYLLVGDFSKWPQMNVVFMFYTFGEIKQMEKTASR